MHGCRRRDNTEKGHYPCFRSNVVAALPSSTCLYYCGFSVSFIKMT